MGRGVDNAVNVVKCQVRILGAVNHKFGDYLSLALSTNLCVSDP